MLRYVASMNRGQIAVVACTALAVGGLALVGPALASGSSTELAACAHKQTGALRLLSTGQKCAKAERAITLNQRGSQGPAGPSGARGQQGPQGPIGPDGPQGPAGPTGPAGADGSDGATGEQGPQGEPGLSHAYNKAGAEVVVTESNDSDPASTVISVDVPAGSYAVTFTAAVIRLSGSDAYIACRAWTTVTGQSPSSQFGGLPLTTKADERASIALSGAVRMSGAGSISIRCHDQDSQTDPIVSSANLTAIAVGTLTTQ